MMSIRDILKYFSLDVCAKLDIIEQFKDQKRQIGNFPLFLKVVCITSVFVIAVMILGLLLTLAIGYNYSIEWLMWVGCGFVLCAYFVGKKQEYMFQYIKLLMLIIGFIVFSLGVDAKIGDGDLLMLAGASMVFFAITYNFFNNEVYLCFAPIFISIVLTIYVNINFTEFSQLFFAGMLVIAILMSLIPAKYVNLYPVAKSIIVYVGFALLIFDFMGAFFDDGYILYCYLSGIVFVLGIIVTLFKKDKHVLLNVFFVAFLFAMSLLTTFGVGYSSIVMLMGYILGSVGMFFFGVSFFVLYLIAEIVNLDASLEYKSLLLSLFAFAAFAIAFLYKKEVINAKKQKII